MADEDDFTFCQTVCDKVGLPVEDAEARKAADRINSIQINDGSAKAVDKRVSDDIREIHMDDGKGNSSDQNGGIWKTGTSSHKQGRVGSLSFNVVNASSDKESSINASPQANIPVRKASQRNKVPFEKGYSQMDWLKLTRTHPDLAGLKGQSDRRRISMNEVKQHQSEGSMWTVLKGRVYNISPYMKFHPGVLGAYDVSNVVCQVKKKTRRFSGKHQFDAVKTKPGIRAPAE
ncbi:hypothetical protein OROGR_030283 [Orobanche gracilis]